MNKGLATLAVVFFASTQFLITACSSEDSGGGISPPKDAIVFNDSNAASSADLAVGITEALQFFKGGSETPAVNDILVQLVHRTRQHEQYSGVDLVSGPAYEDSYSCADSSDVASGTSNSVSHVGSFSIDANGNESGSGTTTFYDCMVSGIIIDGGFSYSYTESTSGDYTDSAHGSLTMTIDSTVASLSNFSLSDSGNYNSGDFTITKLQYVFDPGSNGFSMQVTATVVGNDTENCPMSGQILLKGGSNTKVQITFASGTTLSVDVDEGSGFVPVSGSPFPCT